MPLPIPAHAALTCNRIPISFLLIILSPHYYYHCCHPSNRIPSIKGISTPHPTLDQLARSRTFFSSLLFATSATHLSIHSVVAPGHLQIRPSAETSPAPWHPLLPSPSPTYVIRTEYTHHHTPPRIVRRRHTVVLGLGFSLYPTRTPRTASPPHSRGPTPHLISTPNASHPIPIHPKQPLTHLSSFPTLNVSPQPLLSYVLRLRTRD